MSEPQTTDEENESPRTVRITFIILAFAAGCLLLPPRQWASAGMMGGVTLLLVYRWRKDVAEWWAEGADESDDDKRGSWEVFVFLLLFLWPAAIIYYRRRTWGTAPAKNQRAVRKLEAQPKTEDREPKTEDRVPKTETVSEREPERESAP